MFDRFRKMKRKDNARERLSSELFDFMEDYDCRSEDLIERISNVTEWYTDHSDVDPNLYEFVEIAGDAGIFLSKKNNNQEDKEKVLYGVETLGDIVADRLVERELACEGDALHMMVIDAKEGVSKEIQDHTIVPFVKVFINKKVIGVGEFLAKLKRNYQFSGVCSPYEYANREEYNDLVLLMDLGRSIEGYKSSREGVFAAIKKWHEQPIFIDNVDDYSFLLDEKVKNEGYTKSL